MKINPRFSNNNIASSIFMLHDSGRYLFDTNTKITELSDTYIVKTIIYHFHGDNRFKMSIDLCEGLLLSWHSMNSIKTAKT